MSRLPMPCQYGSYEWIKGNDHHDVSVPFNARIVDLSSPSLIVDLDEEVEDIQSSSEEVNRFWRKRYPCHAHCFDNIDFSEINIFEEFSNDQVTALVVEKYNNLRPR